MRAAGRLLTGGAAAAALVGALPAVAAAADGAPIDSGNTAWLLMSTALVMVMLPGLALFYGGLVRRKNVLSTVMHSFFGLALVSIVWVLIGFSLAFGTDVGGLGLIGGLDYVGFMGVGLEPSTVYAVTIPFILFAAFQLMFAAITPALISGAFAERKRFGAFVLFTVLWSIFVYSPIAHWVWSVDGWLFKLGALDFAGGTVVHASSGISALIVALLIGRRVVNGDGLEPHDIPMTVLGAGLLWFGWFGFNAGSATAADGLAANALLVTNVAAAAATISWVLLQYVNKKKVSVVGAACGAVAGLVAITPASGYVTAGGALDFAGGTVVHISSGVSALIVALLIGRRTLSGERMEPHDVPMTVLGAGLLWFGWFGFNAGSAVAANGLAASAFIVTNTAAAAATITWVLASYLRGRKVSVIGAACGAVAGLVAITPASGFVSVGGALIIGFVAGGLCFSATLLRERLKVDDALDVFAVHGVGGMFGALATGIFATAAVQPAFTGLIEGNAQQLVNQLIAVVATVAYAVIATFVIVKVVDAILGIRVTSESEAMGLDLAVHGEAAYQS